MRVGEIVKLFEEETGKEKEEGRRNGHWARIRDQNPKEEDIGKIGQAMAPSGTLPSIPEMVDRSTRDLPAVNDKIKGKGRATEGKTKIGFENERKSKLTMALSPGPGHGMERSVSGLQHNPPLKADEVREYKIHVSSKYLELTQKKLELTRLPHEVEIEVGDIDRSSIHGEFEQDEDEVREAREWALGVPKGVVEPLVDYWLETYAWRDREAHFNSVYPQFRTALHVPSQPRELRLHFIHLRSFQSNAVPLLLLPSFPLSNLSLPLTLLEGLKQKGFHVVVPSLPGLGFSDAFTTESDAIGVLEKTAALLDSLMSRLGYEFYLCSATGSGRGSPAGIDYHLPRILGSLYGEHCLGVHVIDPCVEQPRNFLSWMKFKVAEFFHANIWGYQVEDFVKLKPPPAEKPRVGGNAKVNRQIGTMAGMLGLREPHTLAYALCDSPVGLLGLVTSALRGRGTRLIDEETIDVTMLAWLPGPEAAMRFWASADKDVASRTKSHVARKHSASRSRAVVSVINETSCGEDFSPPAWAQAEHTLLAVRRAEGGTEDFVRPDVILAGCQVLASEINERDARLRVEGLKIVVVDGEALGGLREDEDEDEEVAARGVIPRDAESPDTVVAAPSRPY